MKRYRRLARLFWRSRRTRKRETEEEIEAHLAMRMDELRASGLSDEEARREALARFGDLDEARRRIVGEARRRDARLGWMDHVDAVKRDGTVALRRIRRRPGHSLLSTAIFGLGIGLTTVMFTFVDNVLLRPLPFPEPHRLVALWSVAEDGGAFPYVSMGNWYDWDRRNRTLESSALHSAEPRDVTVSTEGGALAAPGVTVYGAFFETLRMPMVAGRAPSEAEVRDDPTLVVVAERFWRAELGARPPADGVTLNLEGRPRTVVGVVAGGYEHPENVDVWIPQPARAQTGAARNNINFQAVGRLRDGTTTEQAEADLSAIAESIRATDPEGIYSYGVGARSLDDVVVGSAEDYLVLLMGAVVLVLLVACANLAALGFARGTERSDEIAVRLSLGAGARRVVQQLLTEELILALAGGLVGILLAWWGTGALLDGIHQIVPRSRDVGFDGRVVAFGAGMSILAGLAAGLPPALRAAVGGPRRLQAAGRTVRGRGGLPGALMVTLEVAMTVLLLTGGGLMLMSFGALASRDLGFEPEGVVTVDVALTAPRYRDDTDAVTSYWEALLDDLGALPGVRAVGAGLWIPTGDSGTGFIELDGRPAGTQGAGYRIVGGDYFEALRIPRLQGRVFDDRDRLDTELVTVVNRTMADRYWPDTNPVGQRVRATSMESYWFGGEAPWRTVIGVVGDVRHHGFESDPRAEMFVPFRQNPWMSRSVSAVVLTSDDALGSTLAAVRSTVRALDGSLAVEAATLEGRLDGLLSERRMIVWALSAYALAALLLAALGIYGVVSHAVARRTREMAIRSALGARRAGLVRLVLVGALRLVALGLLLGIASSIGLRGVLDSLLVDVQSGDPRAYLLAGGCLVAVAVAAALIPATRAARMDPLAALRRP